jgi:hypothetical protein
MCGRRHGRSPAAVVDRGEGLRPRGGEAPQVRRAARVLPLAEGAGAEAAHPDGVFRSLDEAGERLGRVPDVELLPAAAAVEDDEVARDGLPVLVHRLDREAGRLGERLYRWDTTVLSISDGSSIQSWTLPGSSVGAKVDPTASIAKYGG